MELKDNLTINNIIVLSISLAVIYFMSVILKGKRKNKSPFHKKSTAKEVLDAFGTTKYLSGKTAIVTGGNSGIGLETCKVLAYAGCRVILCSRSKQAGEKMIEIEIKNPGQGNYSVADTSNIIVKTLDLEDLKSVKDFAVDILASEARIDFLVLNAGIMALPKCEYTSAGFERQIGVNHFGHAYLTALLLDKIKKQSFPSRIVVLSSIAHSYAKGLHPNDLHYKIGRIYSKWEAYGQSKLANILFAKSLSDKLKGSQATAVSLHPGVVMTNLYQSLPPAFSFISSFFADKTIPQGASTTVWACLDPSISKEDGDGMRGAYLVDCARANPSELAQDKDGTKREALWIETYKQLSAVTGESLN